jgi:hypothetical protein
MEKAKRDCVPVKVELQVEDDFVEAPLNPALPAKKNLPFLDDVAHTANDGIRNLKPGTPLKKRVNTWLLEGPSPVSKITAR